MVADVRIYGQTNDAPDLMYFTARQHNAGFGIGVMNLAARVRGDPESIAPQVRAALRAIDADVPLSAVQSVESICTTHLGARLRTRCSLVCRRGAVLAVVGLYGMLAYSVTQRSRGDGDSHGARRTTDCGVRMVIRQGWRWCGDCVRCRRCLAATKLLAAQLFAVTRTDPVVFVCGDGADGGGSRRVHRAGEAGHKADPIRSRLRLSREAGSGSGHPAH